MIENNYRIKSARGTAISILYDIEEKGSYTNIILKKKLDEGSLSQVDKGLVKAIVYGTEKNKLFLDSVIASFTKKSLKSISPWILAILRTGIYQILYLDKVPSFAIVNECVEISKSVDKGRGSGFVNGVLRNVARNADQIKSREIPENLKYSVPKWLFDFVKSFYGSRFTTEFFKASMDEPELNIRVNTLKTNKLELQDILRSEGIESFSNKYVYDSLKTLGMVNISDLESYKKGLYIIQDEGAMLSVEAMDLKDGNTVLDMCAAPGGKTTHIAQKIGSGTVVARDVHKHKIKLIEDNLKRMGMKNAICQLHDGSMPPDRDELESYDSVLLDAPCSGIGIIRRKPDIKYNLTPKKLHELQLIQKNLILNAYDSLKKGGLLVYTTCTINPRENQGVVDFLLKKRPDCEIDREFEANIFNGLVDENGFVKLFPNVHGTDGFFIARIRKK
ncbi:16S rRNA (cytosine(967)-C(5))-methyltransferase RsmB [Alkalibacter mobilis]|uniref:16S rRNA (cytosine(967)-C(5))-methyltransferase RsmB n=1 Tax=Alkalibacter mobilis TaxID=2787712 RepID=UPI00189F6B68|nr:16S rRNA (cytosine(967)-C(5))-methyltransferase RsmB [Alkalibacter mobilis]MBF7095856.1 16S rRNA (cytosine(967)-C(5))-methyltransferase RsmB [Alkalibacter mobilis]